MKQTFTHTDDKGLTEVEYDVQVQEVESVKGSKSPISGVYLAEAKKIRGRSTKSNKSKNAFTQLKPVGLKKMSDKEWLTQAGAADDRPEAIQFVHSNWAADGFRLHKIEDGKECNCKFCKNRKEEIHPMSPQWEQLFPRFFKGEVALNSEDILNACNLCKVFSREGSNVTRIYISNENVLSSAISEETGKSENSLSVKSKQGIDLKIAFNTNFILDAVKGMGKTVTIKYNGSTSPAIFTDGKRTALLMPMHLDSD